MRLSYHRKQVSTPDVLKILWRRFTAMRGSNSVHDEFEALANAHTVLHEADGHGAEVPTLIERELAPYFKES